MLWSAVDLEQKTARVVRRIRWDQRTKRPYLEETTKSSDMKVTQQYAKVVALYK
ncbi:MAG: hypothetical protein OXJ52_08110 [Oligoflexia bacterium]|nr:hypothetical protein [Oligoflexia bacterium]